DNVCRDEIIRSRHFSYVSPSAYDGRMRVAKAKVTSNGQVSLPAELRHRWEAPAVLVIDRGDYAIVRPIPADPIAALRGVHAGPGPSVEELRAAGRAAEAERERSRGENRT